MSSPDDFLTRQPAVSHPSERPVWVRRPRVPSNNWAAWTIAFLPLGQVIINVAIGVASGGQTTWANVGIITVALWAGTVTLARVDRRELDAWGFENTASSWLVLLTPPVYLAVRGNRVWRRTTAGLGPFWASLAVLIALPVGLRIFEVFITVRSLLPG